MKAQTIKESSKFFRPVPFPAFGIVDRSEARQAAAITAPAGIAMS